MDQTPSNVNAIVPLLAQIEEAYRERLRSESRLFSAAVFGQIAIEFQQLRLDVQNGELACPGTADGSLRASLRARFAGGSHRA